MIKPSASILIVDDDEVMRGPAQRLSRSGLSVRITWSSGQRTGVCFNLGKRYAGLRRNLLQ